MKQRSIIISIVSIVILIFCVIIYSRNLSNGTHKENFDSKTGNIRAFYRKNRRKLGGYVSNTFSNYKNGFNRKIRKLSM